jgi:hypothetical protein
LSCSGAFHKLYSSTSKDGDVKMQNWDWAFRAYNDRKKWLARPRVELWSTRPTGMSGLQQFQPGQRPRDIAGPFKSKHPQIYTCQIRNHLEY